MKKKRTFFVALLVVASFAAAGCKKKQKETEPAPKSTEGSGAVVANPGSGSAATAPTETPPVTTKTIIDVAKEAGTFTTLLKAIDAAGLTERLSGAGPFTVFAPTDEAFAKLPPKNLEALLADKPKLEALLQFHVVTGAVASKDLATQKSVKSLQGGELAVDATSGVKIAGATVVKPDIAATNGVITRMETMVVRIGRVRTTSLRVAG
jgi:uncharacterized surface protein with fasciclin (FAS1) repeats